MFHLGQYQILKVDEISDFGYFLINPDIPEPDPDEERTEEERRARRIPAAETTHAESPQTRRPPAGFCLQGQRRAPYRHPAGTPDYPGRLRPPGGPQMWTSGVPG